MKRIRIGKDINVQWVLHAPAGVVLTSENLTIELKDPKGRQKDIDTFTLETSQDKFTVNFALRGTAFSQLGNYTFTAWLNKGEQGQSVVDAVNAFTLVGSTQAEDDLQSCGCGHLDIATIDLQGVLSFVGQPGYSPTANVVKEGDTVTITITDKDGTTSATFKDGKDGDDGISPTATISKSGDTTTLAITDKTGIHIAEIKDGVKGDDGVSPTANVVKSGNTATITITDKNGISSASISDGADGNDGISPTVSTSKSGSVTTITITDINGQHTATINDGENPQEIFWATYGTTTAAQIQAALDAGKVVMCNYSGRIYTLGEIVENDRYNFYSFSNTGYNCLRIYIIIKSNTWGSTSTYFETTGARITSTSSTEPSDATHYTALATKNLIDAVDAKIEGPWAKLVDTILEEDTTNTGFSVNLNKDCSKLKIIAVFPANASLSSNTSCYLGMTGRSGSTTLICGSSPLRSTPAKVIAEYTYESGLGWQGVLSQFANATFNEDGNNAYSVVYTNLRGANVGDVYSVRIYGNNVPLIAGTKIQIWGK